MKAYNIKVSLLGTNSAGFEIVPNDTENYNIFNNLKDAKQYALNNMPVLHPSDISYWREQVRNTTLQDCFDNLFEDIKEIEKLAYPDK